MISVRTLTLVIVLVLLACTTVNAQESVLDRAVNIELQSGSLADFLKEIQKEASVSLSYSQNHIARYQDLQLSSNLGTVRAVLEHLLQETDLDYTVKGRIIIIKKKSRRKPRLATLNGTVREQQSGEVMIGAAIYIPKLQQGTTTNTYGFYSLSVPPGDFEVHYSYLGSKSEVRSISLRDSERLDVELSDSLIVLNTLEVVADPYRNVTNTETGVVTIDAKTLTEIPFLYGEKDVISGVRLLPGLTTVGEGASGFNVRGGDIDQNLLLLDEAPVYNSAHYYGLFSVFNPAAVKSMKLLKGGIPASYGGGSAAVFDIKQREGNTKKFKMTGGLGVPAIRLNLEGPLVKGRSSYLIATRSTFTNLSSLGIANFEDSEAGFSDLNVKLNYQLDPKNRLYLSGYLGDDTNEFNDTGNRLQWGNTTATLRWNHTFNHKLFANFTAVYSRYKYQVDLPGAINNLALRSKLLDYIVKADFNYYFRPGLTLDYGVNLVYHRFQPGTITTSSEVNPDRSVALPSEKALEVAVYGSLRHQLTDRLKAEYGLRLSSFRNLGPQTVFQYQPGQSRSISTISDTLNFDDGETVKRYQSLEPRLALVYRLDKRRSLKFSYNFNRQYTHLISNSTAAQLTDLWKLSDTHIKPKVTNQFSMGYYWDPHDDLEFSGEFFYRKFNHLLEYRDNADLVLNPQLETEVVDAAGKSYGMELFLRKTKGALTGWIAYTWSRSKRRTSGAISEDQINNGALFNANFDRPHDLKLLGSYRINHRWHLSASWQVSSGRPVSYPDGSFQFEGIQVPVFSQRNGQRLPAYHRLDISANLKGKNRKNRRWQGSWTFALYNVYGRSNPFSVVFNQNPDGSGLRIDELSILDSPIPSVTYNFTF